MEPEILAGKLEALPRAENELSWFEIWLATICVTCVYLMCVMLVHAAIVKP